MDRIARSQTAPRREVVRELLAAADGVANTWIAADLGVTVVSVRAWRARFESEGLSTWGKVARGRGRRASIPQAKVKDCSVIGTLLCRFGDVGSSQCVSMGRALDGGEFSRSTSLPIGVLDSA